MQKRIGILTLLLPILFLSQAMAGGGKILIPLSTQKVEPKNGRPEVIYHGYNSFPSGRNILNLDRKLPWSLPAKARAAGVVDTVRLLGLRFDFTEEIPDDPNTTGNGKFDLGTYEEFATKYLHTVDPSPHNRNYFESHFQALRNYYFFVSDGQLELTWDVFPLDTDAVYHLPHSMSYYGGGVAPNSGDTIGKYLTQYFIDCIQLVDSSDPAVVFGDYDSYFLFHAGSDRQNDLGFPETSADLYTGFIFFIDTATGLPSPALMVDGGATAIVDGLIMPELASQDNRATALNAVLAHEFGHQLGLVDLYRTDIRFTRVGDFALMDNNGFGTSIDFGFEVGGVLGAMPVYPMAWSRAFLGFDSVRVFREGTAIDLVAAEMSSQGTQIAKIPISEYEYYLLENRQEEIDGKSTVMLADSITSVFLGPVDLFKTFTGEYDFLLPGSGILIWHVDEAVAALDYDGRRGNNFLDNQLQNDPMRPFIELVEADGQVHLGGNYYSGFGTQEDMYYADNNSSFTPNTNPAAFGYGGVNSHIYITNISSSGQTMTFDLDQGFQSDGFPVRVGTPDFGLSPITADLREDDSTEIIIASGRNLLVVKADNGDDFTPTFASSQIVYDTVYSKYSDIDSAFLTRYPIPVFARLPRGISAGPIVGNFYHNNDTTQYVAVGVDSMLYIYTVDDNNFDGLADPLDSIALPPYVIYLSGGNGLNAMVWQYNASPESIQLFDISYDGASLSAAPASPAIEETQPYGLVRMGDKYVVLAGDSEGDVDPRTNLYYISDSLTIDKYETPESLDGFYKYGPVAADLNRDGNVEIIVATPDGQIKVVSIDTTSGNPFSLYKTEIIDDSIGSNPVMADLDNDGYADIVLGGSGQIYAFDQNLVTLSGYPMAIDRNFPNQQIIAPPIVGDINNDKIKDLMVINSAGLCYALSSIYSFNEQLLYGFPVTAGFAPGQAIIDASPVVFEKSNGGGLGLLGGDGWFYSYDVGYDSALMDWPMAGGSDATNYLADDKLGAIRTSTEKLPENKFYCYPNPTMNGRTTIRYYLGADAGVTLSFYDMSGKLVTEPMKFDGFGGTTDEKVWDGSLLPTGVYRCVIEAEFSGGEKQATFTDIAIIK